MYSVSNSHFLASVSAVYGWQTFGYKYNIADTVEWQDRERASGTKWLPKKADLDEPLHRYWLPEIHRALLLVTMYDVFIRMYTYTGCNACTGVFVSWCWLHAGGGPSMHRWRVWNRRERARTRGEREKELYIHVRRTVTLRSTHGSKGFTDGIPHTRREQHIGRGSHTVSHDLLACHPPDLLSSSSHGWSKIQRSVPYITSLSARSSRHIDSFFPRTPAKQEGLVWCRSTTVHPPCFTLCSLISAALVAI